MNDNNQPMDVCIGEKFLELAKVPGGFFYSNEEKKTDCGRVSEVLGAPKFVYILMDGNAPFPSTLFFEFIHNYHASFLPDYDLVINEFERVCQPEEIIGKYHLDDLKYEDKGNGPLKAGDFLVCIEIKRIDNAGFVMALFEGIRKALRGLSLGNMPYTYSSSDFEERYEFKFFSSDKDRDFKKIAEVMNNELRQKDWKVTVLSGPDKESGNLCSWKLSAKRLLSNACGF